MTTTARPPGGPDLQWGLAHHLMVLARLERHRLESAGHGEAWQAIGEEGDALLESEALLAGRERRR